MGLRISPIVAKVEQELLDTASLCHLCCDARVDPGKGLRAVRQVYCDWFPKPHFPALLYIPQRDLSGNMLQKSMLANEVSVATTPS